MTQQPMANPGREWAARWSRSIGEAIAHHRKEAGLTAAQLSERCAELGFPISRSQIAGMESGRKESITVAEVQVLSRAIGVPPLVLLFPLGRSEDAEVLPGRQGDVRGEMDWWSGQSGTPVWREIPQRDEDGTPVPEGSGVWRYQYGVRSHLSLVGLYANHRTLEKYLRVAGKRVDRVSHSGDDRSPEERDRLLRLALDDVQRYADELRLVRQAMRERGLLAPRLPVNLLPEDRLDALLDSDELEDREDA